jgi:hypothetical protein
VKDELTLVLWWQAACIKRRATGTDSPFTWSADLEKLRRDNLVISHFGLIAHATDAAGEWDADAAVD